MNKTFLKIGALSVVMLSSSAYAAPGEWWEITAKMEMAGMPYAMPAHTSKVCIAKGAEKDPNYTQGNDSNCRMTDVKHSGNTVRFKGTCINNGETMNLVGETRHDGNSFKSNMKMSGKSGGENIDMTMVNSGKRLGGACDSEAIHPLHKQAEAQQQAAMNTMCDVSGYQARNLIAAADLFVDAKPACPGKKTAYCKALSHQVYRDAEAFDLLARTENDRGRNRQSVTSACGLNMESARKSVCKAHSRKGPISFLDANCPAEAKSYRELQRQRADCEGRGFTGASYGSLMKKCMGGELIESEDTENSSTGASDKSRDEPSGSGKPRTETVLEGAKKLKGLFGF